MWIFVALCIGWVFGVASLVVYLNLPDRKADQYEKTIQRRLPSTRD